MAAGPGSRTSDAVFLFVIIVIILVALLYSIDLCFSYQGPQLADQIKDTIVLTVIALGTFCANWDSFLEGIHDMKKHPFLIGLVLLLISLLIHSLAILISSREFWPNFINVLMICGGTFGLIASWKSAVDCFSSRILQPLVQELSMTRHLPW
jgi:peptidoglycan/LPS O-acetylase OafA/YrhL